MSIAKYIRSLESKLSMVGLVAFVPAVISAAFAAWSAMTSGEINVYILSGNRWGGGIAPKAVSWTEGWARLASPLVLLAVPFVQGQRGSESSFFPFARLLLVLLGIGMLLAPAAYTSTSAAAIAATHLGQASFF